MKQLQRRADIIIKPADKGYATVVMSKEAYLAEAHRQLMDQNYYRHLDQDLTTYHAEQITSLVWTMVTDRHISKETGKYLTPTNPRTARFYHLPKIHKPNHPGRPIVSSCGAPTERISEYVDHHLRPLVVQIPSYIKDTKDFLLKISNLGPYPQAASYSHWMSAPYTPTSHTGRESKPVNSPWNNGRPEPHPPPLL